jgi:GT2 family glycosyltransferase
MEISVVIASHNEGPALANTIESCVQTTPDADYEIVVADDASTDGSADAAERRFPLARVVRHDRRRGASPAKALGARHARGDVLVFLDAHTRPEPGAIARLARVVSALDNRAIVTPTVAALRPGRWQTDFSQAGHGYGMDLRTFDTHWVPLDEMRRVGTRVGQLFESPALIGCAFAIGRDLYDKLWGFDPNMRSWGAEDLDLGLKCWQAGHRILHDPSVVIGHRFQDEFASYEVPVEHVLVNKLRMARKNFTPGVWAQWTADLRDENPGPLSGRPEDLDEHPEGLWARSWQLLEADGASLEQERAYLHARRVRDEFWYAARFGLSWPALAGTAPGGIRAGLQASPAPSGRPSPAPSQPPVTVAITVPVPVIKLGQTETLQATLTPATAKATNFVFQAKRAAAATWTQLASGPSATFAYKATIAGHFNVRVVATVNGKNVTSPSANLTVTFPVYADIVADANVITFTDAAWQDTLAATTPTTRREEGFWIQFNSNTGAYSHTPTILGPVIGPNQTGSVQLGPRPPDVPASPQLPGSGVYTVASFHTHTPTTFRMVGRPVGPSAADNAADTNDDVTGVVYDYIANPPASGSIPAGYPLHSPAQRYHSGPASRKTPA